MSRHAPRTGRGTSAIGRAGTALLLGLSLLSAACPEAPSDDDELTIVVQADTEKIQKEAEALSKKEAELKRQQEEILAARKRLLEAGAQKKDLRSLIEKQRELLEREMKLRAREAEIASARGALDEEKTRLLMQKGGRGGKGKGAASAGAASPALAAREAKIAAREAKIAAREADLSRREKALAEREAAVARREAALLSGALGKSVPVSSGEPGRRVGRKEVERAHKRARQQMRRRGILPEDLPAEAVSLQRQIYRHSKAGRWVQAWDAVDAFAQVVSTMPIDEAFVQAKMQRLNAARKRAKLGAAAKARVEALLGQATGAFADGRYEEANLRLNEIFGLLRRR